MSCPDAHCASGEGGVRRRTARVAAVAALLVLTGSVAAPAFADVGPEDIRSAEASAVQAADRLRSARNELAAAERRLIRIEDGLAGLEERLDRSAAELESGRAEAREHIARMYMSAGTAEAPGWLVVDRISQLPAHVAYLGALAEQDREAVNRLAVSRGDLLRLRAAARDSLADQEQVVAGLLELVDARRAELDAALADVDAVTTEWERQEAERRAREEAERRRVAEEEQRRREEEERQRREEERRRREALEAMQAAAAAAASAGWTPGAGVEPWRPLVEKHFPEHLVEDALSVMYCESFGDPLAINRYSAASGLFQHLPYYWPSRAVKAGWAGADIFDPEANIAVSAWLVRVTVEVEGREPWAHWTCKP